MPRKDAVDRMDLETGIDMLDLDPGRSAAAESKPTNCKCGKRLRSDSKDGACGDCRAEASRKTCTLCGAVFHGDGTICHRHGAPKAPATEPVARMPDLADVRRLKPATAPTRPVPAVPQTLPAIDSLPIEYLARCVPELRRRLAALEAEIGAEP